jgi:GntP family gluconate:H+ symporter
MTDIPQQAQIRSAKHLLSDMPLVVWMVMLAIGLGFVSGLDAQGVIGAFNTGFGRALGEFALILLPSFTLAAAMARQNVTSEAAGRVAALASPVAGAGMICPDTAYAALSPAAGQHKLATAFGAYAGFKLLYPAGPLIVASAFGSLGSEPMSPMALLLIGLGLIVPVWASAILWARLMGAAGSDPADVPSAHAEGAAVFVAFAPFLVLTTLLILGGLLGPTGIAVLDFLMLPKGALLIAAIMALLQTPSHLRRACLDSAVRRTGSLLLVIGAASAFGAVLTGMLPVADLVPPGNGTLALILLFGVTVLFKLAQGSSMATFAAVTPVAAPLVMSSGADPVAAVFAICLGSFIAILPNDSFYWLVRRSALEDQSDRRAILVLSGGAIVQALVGLVVLLLGAALWT